MCLEVSRDFIGESVVTQACNLEKMGVNNNWKGKNMRWKSQDNVSGESKDSELGSTHEDNDQAVDLKTTACISIPKCPQNKTKDG